MGVKHKKTRKEKIVADYRHQVYILKNNNTPLSESISTVAVNENSHINTNILKDVFKTGLLSATIVATEIILFFLLKKHVISIPNLNY